MTDVTVKALYSNMSSYSV